MHTTFSAAAAAAAHPNTSSDAALPSKTRRTALCPITSNTLPNGADAACLTPCRSGPAALDASFSLPTPDASPENPVGPRGCRRVDGRSTAAVAAAIDVCRHRRRRQHNPYAPVTIAAASPSSQQDYDFMLGYTFCGPGVALHASAGPLHPTMDLCGGATRHWSAAVSCEVCPTETGAAVTPAAVSAVPKAAAAPSPVTAVAEEPPRSHAAQHDTSMSSDVSEPSRRPMYAGRRAVAGQSVVVATVKFRFRTETYRVPDPLVSTCAPGRIFVMEGDRGIDAGTVVCVEAQAPSTTGKPSKQLLHVASKADIADMNAASAAADRELQRVRALAQREATHNPQFEQLEVVDVDVQLDRKKIYVHYTSPWRVTFGSFTMRLYGDMALKARIWMNQLNYEATDTRPAPRSAPHRRGKVRQQ